MTPAVSTAEAGRLPRSTALPFEARGSGPAVVLLHGFTGSRDAWEADLLDGLVALGRTVVTVDLPGHGRAARPEASATMEDLATSVAGVLDEIGEDRCDLVGYSMGGRVALATAVFHPGRIRRLVLEGASPGLADAGERESRRRSDEDLADEIVRGGILPFVDRWQTQPLFATQSSLPPEIRARERSRRLAADPEGLAASLRVFGVGRQPSLWGRLGEIRAEVLAVAGEVDWKFGEIAQAMVRAIPRARLAIAPSSGHAVHLERPTWFREIVEEFLRTPGREGEGR